MTSEPADPIAVLASGGLDSAVLLAEQVAAGRTVHPLYVRCGLLWEPAELDHLHRFLSAVSAPNLRQLMVLEAPCRDLYGDHWAMTGRDVPAAGTDDAAVYLPGRNVLLLTKAILWCHLHGVPAVALGTLAANPFPDATPHFVEALTRVTGEAVGGSVRVLRPYADLPKAEVLRRGAGLPLEHTFSCLRPVDGRPCGGCNKCEERRVALVKGQLLCLGSEPGQGRAAR
jgi:7-cyano-7-deazaguanine synthase